MYAYPGQVLDRRRRGAGGSGYTAAGRTPGVISGLAETLPSHAFTSGFSLSLAVQSAGALRGAEGELGGAEEGVRALAVVLPSHALAPGPPDGVTSGGAEALTQVAARRKQGLQVTQAD